jgi:WhiB family redox-sensing transcriptional regulator
MSHSWFYALLSDGDPPTLADYIPLRPAWISSSMPVAICRPMFSFRLSSATKDAAKAVCEPCPVRAECLEFAVDHPDVKGIWAATDERERMALRKLRRASA